MTAFVIPRFTQYAFIGVLISDNKVIMRSSFLVEFMCQDRRKRFTKKWVVFYHAELCSLLHLLQINEMY